MARSRSLWKVTSTTATAVWGGPAWFGAMTRILRSGARWGGARPRRKRMGAMEERATAATGGYVVLCGLNELGYRTLEELVRLGEEVVVIVRSPADELARGARELGATLVPGSYRDQAVLHAAGDRKSTRLNSSHTVISYAVF